MMIINGEGHILGRLASVVSKQLLEGEEIVVLNAEKIMLTGNKYPRRPEDIFRRTVRGMLPMKKAKGKTAFKGFKAFVGVPEEYADAELITMPEAEYNDIKKGMELGEISKLLGAKFE